MPFARVGAMPQPDSQQKQRNTHSGDSSSRQKGITMEDLKKQTALRLAQEQQQHGQVYPKDRSIRHMPDRAVQSFTSTSYDSYNYSSNHAVLAGQPSAQKPSLHQQGYTQCPHRGTSAYPMNNFENATSVGAPLSQGYEQSTGNKRPKPRNTRKGHLQSPTLVKTHAGSRSPTGSRYMHDQRPRVGLMQQPLALPVDIDSMPQTASNCGKSKLPHGLTVHELKEMTKARLQAEAAERHDVDSSKGAAFDQRRVSPLDFDLSGSEGRERAMSRDSTCRNQVLLHHGQASDSMTSIPSLVQVNPSNRELQQKGRQPQVSPLPPGFQNFGSVNPSLATFLDGTEAPGRTSMQDIVRSPGAARESWQQPSSQEAWESASVTSHNSTVVSDYLGSESAFSSGVGGIAPQSAEEMSGIPFNRSRSYTAGAAIGISSELPSYDGTPTSDVVHGSSFFDAAVGGPNRLRSLTLSPQRGLIHEDRPHFSGEELGIPSFSSSGRLGSLSRSRHNYSPVIPPVGSESSRFGYNAGLIGGFSDTVHRPRTSSTTSLPPISHTAEEFALDRPAPVPRFSAASQPLLRTGRITEEDSAALLGGAFAYPYVSSGRDGPASSGSVFREIPTTIASRPPPPPGIFGGNELIPVTVAPSVGANFSRVGSVDSVTEGRMSSGWDGSGANVLGSSSLAQQPSGIDEMLSNDLGSILKLSGATDRYDRDQSNSLNTQSSAVGSRVNDSSAGIDHGSYLY